MQPATQHVVMEYGPQDMRSPSPTSSVGSRHPEDQTSLSDSEGMLDHSQFENKWQDRIGLGKPAHLETGAILDPLIPRPEPGSEDERTKHEQILENLRFQVRELQENEIFEQTLLQGSKAALETHVYTRDNDIDSILRSMMGPSSSSSSSSTSFPTPISTSVFPDTLATSTPFPNPARQPRPRPSIYHPSAHASDNIMANGPWNDRGVTRGGFGAGLDSALTMGASQLDHLDQQMPYVPLGGEPDIVPPGPIQGLGSTRRRRGTSRR